MRKNRMGFTFPELLTVMLMIMLGAALLVPLLADYEVNAGTTGCRSNLRQIGMIMHTYARDRADGEFPLRQARSLPSLNNQYPFSGIVRHLATNGYLNEPRIWVCPSDQFDGPNNDVVVQPAESFEASAFFGVGNISYVFAAGHKLNSLENPATAFMLADESNQFENGALQAGNMPSLTSNDNHGADYRNILYLDGHVNVVTGAAVNAIFDGFVDSNSLQAID